MSRAADASSSPGTYALILRATAARPITVGRFGEMVVVPGYYAYVGSALGPGGLEGRLHHHLSPLRKQHWHIDYLRQAAHVVDIWYAADREHREHHWAHILTQIGGVVAMPRFGASDCTCPTHLFFFAAPPPFPSFEQALAVAFPGALCSRWTMLGASERTNVSPASEIG